MFVISFFPIEISGSEWKHVFRGGSSNLGLEKNISFFNTNTTNNVPF